MMTFRPHDLVWLNSAQALLQVDKPSVIAQYWHPHLPVVIRRDANQANLVPIGIRGAKRHQRAAAWVTPQAIAYRLTPSALLAQLPLRQRYLPQYPALQAAISLANHTWPWRWGITGSLGYSLATYQSWFNNDSDLDVTIEAPQPITQASLQAWQQFARGLPCRLDSQLITPNGSVNLSEWLSSARPVLLKSTHGVQLVTDPWQRPT